jgi:tetratricopeptide (TPR) repeat protein
MVLTVGTVGCTTPRQDRAREYNEDGVHLYRLGNYAEARESFHAALNLQPGDPGLLYNLGSCHERLGDHARAECFYRECLAAQPRNADCKLGLVRALVGQGKWNEAVLFCQEWMRTEPPESAAFVADAWLWHEYGDLPRAQARLQQALDVNPRDDRALAELGRLYESMNRPERALVLYERILARHPQREEVRKQVEALTARGISRPRID